MKKMLIAIIILAVLSVGSVSAFLIVKQKEDKKNKEAAELAADYNLFSFNSDSINSFNVSCEDGEYSAVLSGNEWQLSNSDEFIISTSFVQDVCSTMSDLTAVKDYGAIDDEKKSLYGLDNPTVITLSNGLEDYSINVGNLDPTSEYYYVTVSGKSKIYAISSANSASLKPNRLAMKDRNLMPYTESEIARFRIIKNGSTVYDLTYDDDTATWSLPEEFSSFTVDQSKVTTMLSYATRVEVQEFLDENLEDYSKYDFDKPQAELILNGTDGSEFKMLFSYYGNNAANYTHGMNEATGQVATYFTSNVDFIEYTPKDFLQTNLFDISIYDISGFDFSYNNSNDIFKVDINNKDVKMNGKSASDHESDTLNNFNNFYFSITNIELDELKFDIQPDTSELVMKVNFHLNEGGDKVIELYKENDDSCYVFIDGNYINATIKMDEITGRNSVSEFYDSLIKELDKS